VPCGSVRDLAEVFADPQLAARGMIAELDHPAAGPIRMLGVPVKLSATPGGVRTPPPMLGQHTETTLADLLGMDAGELKRLRAAGAFGA
jgi:crotonobetainyl-CoA:carnitine CoA-transferase CaiB-like acyl-CoA transferase